MKKSEFHDLFNINHELIIMRELKALENASTDISWFHIARIQQLIRFQLSVPPLAQDNSERKINRKKHCELAKISKFVICDVT